MTTRTPFFLIIELSSSLALDRVLYAHSHSTTTPENQQPLLLDLDRLEMTSSPCRIRPQSSSPPVGCHISAISLPHRKCIAHLVALYCGRQTHCSLRLVCRSLWYCLFEVDFLRIAPREEPLGREAPTSRLRKAGIEPSKVPTALHRHDYVDLLAKTAPSHRVIPETEEDTARLLHHLDTVTLPTPRQTHDAMLLLPEGLEGDVARLSHYFSALGLVPPPAHHAVSSPTLSHFLLPFGVVQLALVNKAAPWSHLVNLYTKSPDSFLELCKEYEQDPARGVSLLLEEK